MGLLSVVDALLGRPMEQVLENLLLSENIEVALRGGENEFRGVYDLVLAYERGTWNAVSKAARRINLDERVLPECYLRATEKAAMVV